MGKYTYELLLTFCKEKNIVLTRDYTEEHFHSDLIIECVCMSEECTDTGNKHFYKLIKDEFIHCKPCSYKLRQAKKEATCLENHGVKNPMKSKEIKEKAELTNLAKYGCKRPSQNDNVKEKAKNTCQEKYKKDNPMQMEAIKKKTTRCFGIQLWI